jgi:hypothetical protein
MKKVQAAKVAILAAALAAASSASASVTLTLDSVGQLGQNDYQTVTLTASVVPGGSQSGVEAGFYNLTVNGVATPSFCIDIATDQSENTPYPDYSYRTLASAPISSAGPMGAAAAINIEKLWAAYASPSLSSVDAAALQVAIWEEVALGNGTYTLAVSGNSAVTTEATTMLDSLSGLTAQANLIALTDSGQAYVVAAVPEATTLIAGALLLLPFGASTLRILRRNRMA